MCVWRDDHQPREPAKFRAARQAVQTFGAAPCMSFGAWATGGCARKRKRLWLSLSLSLCKARQAAGWRTVTEKGWVFHRMGTMSKPDKSINTTQYLAKSMERRGICNAGQSLDSAPRSFAYAPTPCSLPCVLYPNVFRGQVIDTVLLPESSVDTL